MTRLWRLVREEWYTITLLPHALATNGQVSKGHGLTRGKGHGLTRGKGFFASFIKSFSLYAKGTNSFMKNNYLLQGEKKTRSRYVHAFIT